MKNFIKTILLTSALLAFAPAAHADVEDGTIVDPAIVAPLMAWVEQMTGTKVPMLPQVVASRSRFYKVVARANAVGRADAAYIPGTVLLDSNRWDPEEPTQISLLVHELVHHAQLFMRGKAWACGDAREGQAYALQNQWLEAQGHSPFVKASWIARVSSCGSQTAEVSLAQQFGG